MPTKKGSQITIWPQKSAHKKKDKPNIMTKERELENDCRLSRDRSKKKEMNSYDLTSNEMLSD